MSNASVRVPPDSTGSYIDAESLSVDGNTVLRQRMEVGITVVANGSVTRPADTTTYASGDVITDSTSAPTKISFTVAREGLQSGVIVSAMMVDSANQTLKPQIELWLFDTSFTVDNDNAVFTPTDAEMETVVAVISFTGVTPFVGDATAGAGGNLMSVIGGLNIPFKCTGALLVLYGILVVRNAYVPVSGEKFTFRLHVLQD